MTTDQETITEYQTDVEVDLYDLLNWGHTYEAFCDLLRDRVEDAIAGGLEIEGLDTSDDDFATMVLTTDYEITSAPRPNVVQFSVTWVVDR